MCKDPIDLGGVQPKDFSATAISSIAREAFAATLADFKQNVQSVGDDFGLLRQDTPELPRYLLTLNAAIERAAERPNGKRLRACDLGGYFGIIAATLTELGYTTELADFYGEAVMTGDEHADLRSWWDARRLTVHDLDLQAPDLALPVATDSVDIVALEAVIEHFPHTPRLVLQEIHRILRPGGLLLLDTPNAGALGTRVGFLMHAEGLWASASDLYFSDVPFAGHSRCFSHSELTTMLGWAGFTIVDLRLFDLVDPNHRATSFAGRVLYDRLYPLVRKRYPALRNCIWIAATPADAPWQQPSATPA